MLSDRLVALLRYAKSPSRASGWQAIPPVLADLYHPEMRLQDVLHHVVAAYEEVLAEPRFCVRGGTTQAVDLLLAPVKGYHAIEMLMGPKDGLQTKYTVEEFYDAIVGHILGQLTITNVGWCRDQLFA